MDSSTTIRKMISGNKITVPNYQRAYSWETPKANSTRKTHTDVFLSDLEEYSRSNANTPYYFGHFLFEEKGEDFYIVDGQQRLTTIIIFLSALFKRLKELRSLSLEERIHFQNIIGQEGITYFSTVDYDNQFFKDYVINQTKQNHNAIETESAKRISQAFDYFVKQLTSKDEPYLIKILDIICKASCTTHTVKNESEAIQMFIFQNNRGKKPSNLEVIKAQFMYNLHLYGGAERVVLLEEIKERFEKIYKSIAKIEYKIDEDDVLLYTLRVHFNSLHEENPLIKINGKLSPENSVLFIKEFSLSLENSFDYLSLFFGKDERESHTAHSLITAGGIAVACPFVIKAYEFGLDTATKDKLYRALESLVLRHRLIGTRAEIASRINAEFKNFTKSNTSIEPIIERINLMKNTTDGWWNYWNNTELNKALQRSLDHSVAKILLWKYENHLKNQGKSGYQLMRYDEIEQPELEHIAPTTEPTETPHGYDNYDEVFRTQYLNCLGNYLLLSKSHNCAVGNIPFVQKCETYSTLFQHREVRDSLPFGAWNKEAIQARHNKISQFVTENL